MAGPVPSIEHCTLSLAGGLLSNPLALMSSPSSLWLLVGSGLVFRGLLTILCLKVGRQLGGGGAVMVQRLGG